mmetsp:Transcript_10806/g.22535  ORF Transcript_10806/g.22535 Transcript_10806/m.22535 type:complete len:212 (+) Transcript_10806:68-703(+)
MNPAPCVNLISCNHQGGALLRATRRLPDVRVDPTNYRRSTDRFPRILRCRRSRRCCEMRSMATVLAAPCGTMMSAYCFVGRTYCSKAGLTVDSYWHSTDSRSRPRSAMSRRSRRASRVSASVSTNIFMSKRSRISGMYSARMPSKMITCAPLTVSDSGSRALDTKSYWGTCTVPPCLRVCREAYISSKANADGWSKFTFLMSSCSSGERSL